MIFNIIKTKKAVVFGMDARVTLIVTSIMLMVVGLNQFVNIEKNNELETKTDLKLIKNATNIYYNDNYIAPTIDDLLLRRYLNLEKESININSDPWGSEYILGSIINSEIILGQKMPVKYFYIFSKGKNRELDTLIPTDKTSWQNLKASGDDFLLKFSSYEAEKEVAEIEQRQLTIIKFLLQSYVDEKVRENQSFCEQEVNQLDIKCDINQDGDYELKEELRLNYLPKETDDNQGEYYIDTTNYKSGYINTSVSAENNMYSFISLIGGHQSLVKSPRGLVLRYDSNKYKNNTAPYFGSVWYGQEVSSY